MDAARLSILQAAEKHPQSLVAKAIHCVDRTPTQRNIVELLIELVKHSEYASDFGISLLYYLHLYQELEDGRDIALNEAGLLVLNSAQIYARRVDCVHEFIEHQILTLSNASNEVEEERKKEQQPRRCRKRLVEAVTDPYEVELVPKKFRKLIADKRFACNKTDIQTRIPNRSGVEVHIHPSGWLHSNIIDLENEEEIDSKRNYKMFTHHIEHRYNTLMSDIHFPLHYKVKDSIDEEDERMEETFQESGQYPSDDVRIWPPLSEEYIEQYLNLENYILELELTPKRKSVRISLAIGAEMDTTERQNMNTENGNDSTNPADNSTIEKSINNSINIDSVLCSTLISDTVPNDSLRSIAEPGSASVYESKTVSEKTSQQHEQILKNSVDNNSDTEENAQESLHDSVVENNSLQKSEQMISECASESMYSQQDSAIGESISSFGLSQSTNDISVGNNLIDETNLGDVQNDTTAVETSSSTQDDIKQNDNSPNDTAKLEQIRVMLPHLNEGVFLSDLGEQDQRMLSPTVVATDVFPSIPNKENITIFMDNELKSLLNVPEDELTTKILPAELPAPVAILNIFKFPEQILKKLNRNVDFNRIRSRYIDVRLLCPLKRTRTTEVAESRRVYKVPKNFSVNGGRSPHGSSGQESENDAKTDNPINGENKIGNSLEVNNNETPAEAIDNSEGDKDLTNESAPTENITGCEVWPVHSTDKSNETTDATLDPGALLLDGPDNSDESTEATLGPATAPVEGPDKSDGNTEATLDPGTLLLDGPDNSDGSTEATLDPGTFPQESTDKSDGSTEATLVPGILLLEGTDKSDGSTEVALVPGTLPLESTEKSNEASEETLYPENLPVHNIEKTNETVVPENSSEVPTEAMNMEDILDNSYDEGVENSCPPYTRINSDLDRTLAEIELNSNKTKIQKWHEYLQPILSKSRERHHFDVFQLGTEIMNEIQSHDGSSSYGTEDDVSLKDVMRNKDATYVSRYFLSSLLLANQNNVKIVVNNKSSENPAPWSDVRFKLISTQRHTVAIEDNIGMVKTATHFKSSVQTKQSPGKARRLALENELLNVNLNFIQTLKPLAKPPRHSDDYDSGIFSSEELT